MDLLLAGVIVLVSVGFALVAFMAREGRVSSGFLAMLAAVCSVGLLVMLVTDWPWEVLADFWADHSVLAGVLSTVLLLGIGFLVFEVWDVHEQEELDASLTAAGMGGMVDHVVEVEVALALLLADEPPDAHGWPGWQDKGRPLRWLRENRERLMRGEDGGPGPDDPRRWSSRLSAEDPSDPAWRVELADQCVRRLLAAIRDWTPVMGRSRTGVQALIRIAELRNGLMRLEDALGRGGGDSASALVAELRWTCRELAFALECASGAPAQRGEVLQTAGGLDGVASRPSTLARRWVRNDWERQLAEASAGLRGPSGIAGQGPHSHARRHGHSSGTATPGDERV